MANDVIAIIAFHNEWRHAEMCFRHLARNGMPCWVIDNSIDGADAMRKDYARQIIGWTRQPWEGAFDLREQIRCKQRAADELGDVWIVHQDIDEVFYSDHVGEPLADACRRVGESGYNTISFGEYVFIPAAKAERPIDHQCHYYYLNNFNLPLLRVFRPADGLRFNHDGHEPVGLRALYPGKMQMRHYMFADQAHMREKYARRRFVERDLAIGMHQTRVNIGRQAMPEPDFRRFKCVRPGQWLLDDSDGKERHFWEWQSLRG